MINIIKAATVAALIVMLSGCIVGRPYHGGGGYHHDHGRHRGW